MFNQQREGSFPPWLLWVIGPVTVIAAALIIFAVVLGIRAGQRQIETQRRQEVGIALQRAADFQAEGRLQDAVAEYQRVLILEPGNETALAGIQGVVNQATTGEVAVTQPISGTAPPAAAVAPTPAAGAVIAPTAVSTELQTLYDQARTVYGTGQWEQSVTLLLQLQQQAPDFQRTQIEDMLYNAYVNMAAAADQADDLELAIEYVDKALALRPSSSALQAARAIAANYVEGRNQEGVDWARAVELYQAVYSQDPNYRDVSTRLNAARFAFGDALALQKEWCKAEEQYSLALEISVPAGSIARRDDFVVRCAQLQAFLGGTPVPTSTRPVASGTPTITPTPLPTSSLATTVDASTTPDPLATVGADGTVADGSVVSDTVAVAEPEVAAPVAAGPVSGRLLYSAIDPSVGGNNIYLQGVGDANPSILFTGATQPAFRPDGQRVVFRNLDDGMRGLTALDPASGLKLRFTTFSEDSSPSWNGLGNLVAFSSNREGDRRWRLYVLWADVNNEATAVGFGQYPDWHPSEDRFAFQGCDESGNGCGIRSLGSGGGDGRGITSVAADMQPDWASNGAFLAFTSEARDGNPEIYRVDSATGQVTRLTESGGIDAAPAVSPDSAWVAFLSNRSGAWAIWAVPSGGGEAQQLFVLQGSVNVWQDFELQWIN